MRFRGGERARWRWSSTIVGAEAAAREGRRWQGEWRDAERVARRGFHLELKHATWRPRLSMHTTRRDAPALVGHDSHWRFSKNGDSVYDDNDCQRHFDVSIRLIHCSFAKTMYMKNVGVPSIYNFFQGPWSNSPWISSYIKPKWAWSNWKCSYDLEYFSVLNPPSIMTCGPCLRMFHTFSWVDHKTTFVPW